MEVASFAVWVTLPMCSSCVLAGVAHSCMLFSFFSAFAWVSCDDPLPLALISMVGELCSGCGRPLIHVVSLLFFALVIRPPRALISSLGELCSG